MTNASNVTPLEASPRAQGVGFMSDVRTQQRLSNLIAYVILILGSLIMIGPFLWMISTALKLPADQFNRTFIPNPATLENFVTLRETLPIEILIWNSFKIAAITTIGQVLTCAMAAFVFAVVEFRFRQALFLLLLATLMVPPQVTIVPNFILFRWLGLFGTQAPLWLPAFWGGAFGTFLLRQYFRSIPLDLAEAARVDGASLMQIFWRIYLPLARPALAALAIFSFLGAWNNLLTPLIYLPADLNQTTLPVALALLQQQYPGRWTVQMAGALVSVAPIIAVFFLAQRQFIEGIALSGVRR